MTARSPHQAIQGIRLQKVLPDAGVGARRDCEELILAGRVRVNGRVVQALPTFVDPLRDVVELDEEPVDLSAVQARQDGESRPATFTYVLVNKPRGVITTTRDPEGRRNVLDLLPAQLRHAEGL